MDTHDMMWKRECRSIVQPHTMSMWRQRWPQLCLKSALVNIDIHRMSRRKSLNSDRSHTTSTQ